MNTSAASVIHQALPGKLDKRPILARIGVPSPTGVCPQSAPESGSLMPLYRGEQSDFVFRQHRHPAGTLPLARRRGLHHTAVGLLCVPIAYPTGPWAINTSKEATAPHPHHASARQGLAILPATSDSPLPSQCGGISK
jgi:hypothetical protein